MSEINPKIFKAYDIRGIYPTEINEDSAEIIGRALVRFLINKSKKRLPGKLKIVIGRDTRSSSKPLFSAFKKGILKEGQDVIDIGLAPTPMFYFAVWSSGFDGGAEITASHNPPEYNGLKIVGKGAKMLGINSGLEEIKKIAFKIASGVSKKRISGWGKLRKKSILKEYLEFNFQDINLKKLRDLKIVIDTGNAVPGVWIKELEKYLPFKIYHLFPELSGDFPNHLPNPLEEKNIKDLKNFVRKKKASLGVAFDGDGDRIVFIDEKGETIPPDFITCLISEILLKKEKNAFKKSDSPVLKAGNKKNRKKKIVYNICSSNIIKEVVEKNGGEAIAWKVGHTFVKEKMQKTGAIFAGEYSGHYFLRNHHFCEAPLFILLKILEEMSLSGKPISKILVKYKKYFNSGQINLEVQNKKKKLEELERIYKAKLKLIPGIAEKKVISHLDGLRINFPNWWFNARPSNTEDLLRIVVESDSEHLMKEKIKELRNIIEKK